MPTTYLTTAYLTTAYLTTAYLTTAYLTTALLQLSAPRARRTERMADERTMSEAEVR
jgi:hypothetical protein